MREQFEQWFFGKMPPRRAICGPCYRHPDEGGVTVRDVRLEFGPEHRAVLHVQLMIPPGKGRFPVFLTNYPRTHPWVATAVRRGYIGCIYFATTRSTATRTTPIVHRGLPAIRFLLPGAMGVGGMRAVDYLYTLPEVDRRKIGHQPGIRGMASRRCWRRRSTNGSQP